MKKIKIITVEEIKNSEIIGELRKELSTHLAFDAVTKKVNKKIIDKEISLHKIQKNPKKPTIIVKKSSKDPEPSETEEKYYARQSIAQCRMEKFLSMTASDLPQPVTKPLACMNPVLKTPKDTLRCTYCDVLFDPTKKAEHMKVCMKGKPKINVFGCVHCSFKHLSRDVIQQHIKDVHQNK